MQFSKMQLSAVCRNQFFTSFGLAFWPCYVRRSVYQSSPVHPVSESKRGGGVLILTKEKEEEEKDELLVSNV